jgi:hypothetical protein
MVHTEFLPESIDKPSLAVMCKVVDIVRHGNNTLELEIRAYAAPSRRCNTQVLWVLQRLGDIWIFLLWKL